MVSLSDMNDPDIYQREKYSEDNGIPWVRSLGWEDALEKEKATHYSILAWRIPWTTVHGVAE